ncbi:uncharacterized protein [Physcomitrium patens]|uniref:Uncharacterized protein n=1 Tax=Physcomitrium patens TaxID=3218 RepID=A0A2K1INK0_PHYPA|nr:hypothetical protein PHYPA_027172 [Physcomitrium patens]
MMMTFGSNLRRGNLGFRNIVYAAFLLFTCIIILFQIERYSRMISQVARKQSLVFANLLLQSQTVHNISEEQYLLHNLQNNDQLPMSTSLQDGTHQSNSAMKLRRDHTALNDIKTHGARHFSGIPHGKRSRDARRHRKARTTTF